MNAYIPNIPAKFVVPLNMNGMSGRMLYLRAPKNKKRQTLLIYGQNSSLEQIYSSAQALNRYGSVTVPDLPGFGGMESFYKIGEKPTVENFADYLAAFIKLRFKRGTITIVGFTFGFAVITRMLQKYPEIAKRTNLLVSVSGFTHYDDLKLTKSERYIYKLLARLLSYRVPASLVKRTVLSNYVIRHYYRRKYSKVPGLSNSKKVALLESGTGIQKLNHLRTLAFSGTKTLKLDSCVHSVDLPVWHIFVKNNSLFDDKQVKKHLRLIYNKCMFKPVKLKNNSLSPVLTKKEVSALIPTELKRQLSKKLRQ